MFRSASVFSVTSFVHGTLDDRLKLHACRELGALDQSVMGWHPVQDDTWYIEHQGMVVLNVARRVRRIPPTLVKERMDAECALAPTMNAYEKRQLKQRIIDQLAPLVIPETTFVPLILDVTQELIIIGSQSAPVLEKILRLLQDSFPGIVLKPRWSKELQRQAIRTAWNKETWPMQSTPQGDVMLIHASGQYQRIRLAGVTDLTVVDDCLVHGYIIVGVRLVCSNGLSCFITPNGHFQAIRYPQVEEEEVSPSTVIDWLAVLELRAWALGFAAWVHESA